MTMSILPFLVRENLQTVSISPVGIQLASTISSWDVQHRQVSRTCNLRSSWMLCGEAMKLTGDLYEIWCLDKVRAGDGTIGDQTSSVAFL